MVVATTPEDERNLSVEGSGGRGKPWKYILVPHDEIKESERLSGYLRFEQKNRPHK
jgi:hypothetical protein